MGVMKQQRRMLSEYWPRTLAHRAQLHATRKERRRLAKEFANASEASRQAAVAEALRQEAVKQNTGWRRLVGKLKNIRDRALQSKPEAQRRFQRGG